MPVGHHESLLCKALESTGYKSVTKPIQVLLAHLIDDDSDYEFWLFRLGLPKDSELHSKEQNKQGG
jgi:hypothetical protein